MSGFIKSTEKSPAIQTFSFVYFAKKFANSDLIWTKELFGGLWMEIIIMKLPHTLALTVQISKASDTNVVLLFIATSYLDLTNILVPPSFFCSRNA